MVLQWSAFFAAQNQSNFEFQETERNAIMMMDSLIKNQDTQNPQYGSARLNTEKKRVQPNNIEKSLLERIVLAQETEQQPVFFQKIELIFEDSQKQIVFETEKKEQCLSVERFVVIENRKAIIRGVVCRE